MEFLPTTLGTRPRLACEIRAEGVVAARAEDAAGILSAVARANFAEGLVAPGLRAGNLPVNGTGRAAVVSAVRKVLETVLLRERQVTLVVPDSAVRVLLLDFDALPAKIAEALPIVRFRLKKLLPFDADHAALSYQVMAAHRGSVQVVAVAMPQDVLAEYESVVREAGFEPGAVLPSTLAALAGLSEAEAPALIVNCGAQGVTTAIVRGAVLLLHRSVDLRAGDGGGSAVTSALPLVDRASSAEEWARQEPVGHGEPNRLDATAQMQAAELERELIAAQTITSAAGEVVQAVSVAAAYFEDTLEAAPGVVLSAGTLGAQALAVVLNDAGVGPVPVREIVDETVIGPAGTSGVPKGWLAGVRGALAN